MTGELRFQLLGPLRAWLGDTDLPLGPPQQRMALATLLLNQGCRVSISRLREAIWSGPAPRTASSTVHGYISRLRSVLGAETVKTIDDGYVVTAGQVDSVEFETLIAHADQVDPAATHQRLRQALRLWVGEPLSGLPGDYLTGQRARLGELRLAALERALAIEVETGGRTDTIVELAALSMEQPFRQRPSELLMLALYRAGRQAEALTVYDRLRAVLNAELGVAPEESITRLRGRILRADRSLVRSHPATPSGAGPLALPTVEDFTGRSQTVSMLCRALTPDGGTPTPAMVSGSAGVGKTAVAVQVARLLGAEFTDGVWFAGLAGTTNRAADPVDILGNFLAALGLPANGFGASLAERAGLFRSATADRRLLIVLDDATDPLAVQALTPGGAGCAVLITTRVRLSGLADHLDIVLPLMTGEEAAALFSHRLGRARAEAEPQATAELLRTCGYLPLAVELAAARLCANPELSIAALTARLAEGHGPTDLFADGRGIAESFSRSYTRLDEASARGFRLLSAVEHDTVTPELAAAVLRIDRCESEKTLESLFDHHLMESTAPGEYHYGPLWHDYARGLASSKERRSAVERLARVPPDSPDHPPPA